MQGICGNVSHSVSVPRASWKTEMLVRMEILGARWKCNLLRKCKPYVEMYVVVEMLVKVEIQVTEESF